MDGASRSLHTTPLSYLQRKGEGETSQFEPLEGKNICIDPIVYRDESITPETNTTGLVLGSVDVWDTLKSIGNAKYVLSDKAFLAVKARFEEASGLFLQRDLFANQTTTKLPLFGFPRKIDGKTLVVYGQPEPQQLDLITMATGT